jgi:hypothetical protein
MNSRPISSYEDLCKEKERLTELLKAQKAQITKDIDELKDEFRPMVSLSENVGKLLSREDGKDPLVSAGANIGIDIIVSSLFSKSNFLLKLVLPAILKNLSSHLLPPAAPALRRRPLVQTTTVQKTIVREQKPVNGATSQRPAPEVAQRPDAPPATTRSGVNQTTERNVVAGE